MKSSLQQLCGPHHKWLTVTKYLWPIWQWTISQHLTYVCGLVVYVQLGFINVTIRKLFISRVWGIKSCNWTITIKIEYKSTHTHVQCTGYINNMDMRNVAILRYRIISGILIRYYHIRVTGSFSPYIYIYIYTSEN